LSRRPLTDFFTWALLPAAAVVMPAHAVTYLSVAQAQKVMFPQAEKFIAVPAATVNKWREALAKRLDDDVRVRRLKFWEARQGGQLIGYFATDAVIGKFELFDFAVAFGPDAVIRQVEVLNYLESHGMEVHDEASWRKQFTGKTADAAFSLESDIRNISGATLSCSHLSDGIRNLTRILKTGLGGSFKTS